MKRVGLTGGIGSGKTYVSYFFERQDVPVFNVDEITKAMMETDISVMNSVIEIFGKESYIDGKLNKPYIANILFSNKTARISLYNVLILPLTEQLDDWYEGLEELKCDIAIVECAILFEMKMESMFDHIIHIWAPEDVRITRVIERNSITEKEVKKRISCQMDESKKMDMADFIIDNSGNKDLKTQVNFVIKSIRDGK